VKERQNKKKQCQEDESGYRSVNFRKYQLVGYSSIMAFGTAIIYENNPTDDLTGNQISGYGGKTRKWRKTRSRKERKLFNKFASVPHTHSVTSLLMKQKKLTVCLTTTIFICLIFIPQPQNAMPIPETHHNHHHEHSTMSLTSAMMYLMKYGYMDEMDHSHAKSANLMSRDGLKEYIMEFQKFAGLDQTGELDEHTITMMSMPRCGVKDKVGMDMSKNHTENPNHRHPRRSKRYALQGSRWRVKDLTYKISQYPTTREMSRRDVDGEIEKALEVWSEHTDLSFTQKRSGKVHIDMSFLKGEHGDGDPFDGSGGTLAHAFFPVFGGDAHFDDSEQWTKGSFRGTNLLQTAAHEFGHSLGLSHTDDNDALMAPFYRGFEVKPKLNQDDIKAIQALYGKKTSRPTNSVFGSNSVPLNEIDTDINEIENDSALCSDPRIGAIVTVEDNSTYVFKGKQYYKLTDDSVEDGYPRDISRDWDGLPGNIDAGFTWKNGKTYLFSKDQYWRFTNKNRDSGYPKPISKGFAGIPNFIDAAFVWSGNGLIYFFKNGDYYRFNPEERPPVKSTYPKPISNWEGIPDNIDDALKYKNGFTYFFKNGQYWRFDDRAFKVDKSNPSFPRQAGVWWFGCSSRPRAK